MPKRDPSKTYKARDPDPTLVARRSTARAERVQPEKDYKARNDITGAGGPEARSQASTTDSNMNPANPSLEVETTEPAALKPENAGKAADGKPGAVADMTAEKSLQPDATEAQIRRREAKAQRENAEAEEARRLSGEARKRGGKFTPVHAAPEMQKVWRVFEANGNPAGAGGAAADAGGFWDASQFSKDPERRAHHLAAQINERRERAGRFAKRDEGHVEAAMPPASEEAAA